MRDSLRGLAISGALAVAAACAPVMAQTGGAAQSASSSQAVGSTQGANSAQAESSPPPADASASPAQAADPAGADTSPPSSDSSVSPPQAASPPPPASPAPPSGPAPSSSLAPATGAAAVAIPDEDLKEAATEIRRSWHDYDKCTHSKICYSYFESFGVGITFADGEIVPFAHVQRLTASRHDCIVNAREAADHGNRGMAVQWVMASQITDPLDRNWLGDHPDAVLQALKIILF
jgi:hypothetical protein